MGSKYISKSEMMDEHLDGTTEHLMSNAIGSRGDMKSEGLVVQLDNKTHCDGGLTLENIENERKSYGFKIYETVRLMIGNWRLPTEKWRLLTIVTCVLMVSIVAVIFRITETSKKVSEFVFISMNGVYLFILYYSVKEQLTVKM